MSELEVFEEKVLASLKKILDGQEPKVIGLAVSGGADSVSLLLSLSKAFSRERQRNNSDFPKAICVSVDHSIREEEQSSGDAKFVQDLCASLGVECYARKIQRGLVQKIAAERGKGLEEAARFLRYKEFEAFREESGAQFICLAHNQNDALETLLMRFLQGASAASSGGIAARRGFYLRPLLEISREEIENYLRAQNLDWRTDLTNFDNKYLRNKTRNLLIPFLDENFEGWKKGLLSGAEKALFESEALESYLDLCLKNQGEEKNFFEDEKCGPHVEFSKRLFLSMPVSLRQRLLFRAFDFLKAKERVPYSFIREISFWPEKDFKNIRAAGLEAFTKKDKVFVKIQQKEATESGFFGIIYEGDSLSEAYVLRSKATGDKVD